MGGDCAVGRGTRPSFMWGVKWLRNSSASATSDMSAEVMSVLIGVIGAIVGSSLTAGVFMQRIRALETREDERAVNLKDRSTLWRERLARLENRVRDVELQIASHKRRCGVSGDQ